jgi:outer membrane receptor for ferrienterochelin and colicins
MPTAVGSKVGRLARATRCASRLVAGASLGMLAAVAVPAQQVASGARADDRGSVQGRVVDASSNRPLARVEVSLRGPTARTTRADDDGRWHFDSVPAGRYVVRARVLGHVPREVPVDVRAGDQVSRTIALETAPLSLDQIVVTAARREQLLKDATITTELVTREDLERSGASDLASVLTEQTGIELQGGHPAGAGVMLQGIGSERVLILLDGRPLAGRISGVLDISRIPVSVVERIEVVKGAQSTLYGSEAMGGVINIITRTPPENTLEGSVNLVAGSQDRRDGGLGLVAGRGRWSSSFDVNRRSVEVTPGLAETVGALSARTDAAGKLRWRRDSALLVEASVLALDERQRWQSSSFYNFGDNRQWTGRVGAEWRKGRHQVTPTLFASVYDHLSRGSTEPKPIAGDTGQRQLQRVFQGELLYNGLFGTSALDVGAIVRRDDTKSVRVPGGLRQLTSFEPFAQLEVQRGALSLVPGVRVSWNDQWGTHVTPRVAARLRATDRLTLRASAGTGFRAPDFKELYMFFQNVSAGYAVVGNPELRPEKSRNLTGGVEWGDDRAYGRGQLFYNKFRDFIETRPITGPGEAPVFEYANIDNGTTRGGEVEGGAVLGRLRLEGAYSYLTTRDEATDSPLLGRPTHSGRIGTRVTVWPRATISLNGVATGRTPMERSEETGMISSWRDAYVRFDARLSAPLRLGIDVSAGIDNLFDQRPENWAGYTGRQVYAGLSWTARSTRRATAPSSNRQ